MSSLYPCSDSVFLNGLVSKPSLSTGLKHRQPPGTTELRQKGASTSLRLFNLGQTATLVPHPYDKKLKMLENKACVFTYIPPDAIHAFKTVCVCVCVCVCAHARVCVRACVHPFEDQGTTLWNWFTLPGGSKDQMCVSGCTQQVPLLAESSLQPTTHTF